MTTLRSLVDPLTARIRGPELDWLQDRLGDGSDLLGNLTRLCREVLRERETWWASAKETLESP